MSKRNGIVIRIGATHDTVEINGGDKGTVMFDRSAMSVKAKGQLRRTIVGAYKAA